MNRWLPWAGLAVLLFTFALAGTRVWRHTRVERDPSTRVLRLAHTWLHDNMRAAIQQIATDYEALHPGVKIALIEVPGRVNDAWQRTQLTGGTPPDLMQINMRMPDEEVAQHFRPITDAVFAPNPYNAGTPLAGVRWKDTFVEGLTSAQAYYANLLEYYGIPPFAATPRVFINLELYARIAPGEPLPEQLDAFLALAPRVQAYVERTGHAIMPIAGADDNAQLLLGRLFSQQTQRLSLALNHERTLDWGGAAGGAQAAAAFLRGEWSPATEPALTGWRLMHDSSALFQTGFLQAKRENVTFHFLQGNALMIVSGSWEANTLINQTPFEVGVFTIPLPTPDHPAYGRHILGDIAEGSGWVNSPLAVTALSPHPELAVDFLRYLTSATVNQRFAAQALRVPIIAGLDAAAEIAPFMPNQDGYPAGFSPEFNFFANRALNFAYTRNLHLLVSPQGGVECFVAALAAAYPAAARSDLQRYVDDGFRVLQRGDSVAVAHLQATDTDAARRASAFFERQNLQEAEYLQHTRTLHLATP